MNAPDPESILHEEAEQLTRRLEKILRRLDGLKTREQAEEESGNGNDRYAVNLAESIADRLLRAANVNDMGGCPLCRS